MAGSLLHTPSEIIQALMVAQGYGTLPSTSLTSWPISRDKENTAAESTITVYDDEGVDRGRIMFNGARLGMEAYQIRVRAPTPAAAWLKARLVAVAMDALYLVTVPLDLTSLVRKYYTVHSINRGQLIPLHENKPTSAHGVVVFNCLSVIKMNP